jgi:DNA-binding MarR family transcriptional regulator
MKRRAGATALAFWHAACVDRDRRRRETSVATRADRTVEPGPSAVDDAAAIDLWGRVIAGFQTTNKRLHDAIRAAFSLNEAEAETLLSLGGNPEHRAPMAALARATSFTSGGYTKIADRLTERGLVRRTPCATDRRVTYLELTDRGIELAAELRSLVADINRFQFVDVLGPERADSVADAMAELHRTNAARAT